MNIRFEVNGTQTLTITNEKHEVIAQIQMSNLKYETTVHKLLEAVQNLGNQIEVLLKEST